MCFSSFRKIRVSYKYRQSLQNVIIIQICCLVSNCSSRYYTVIEDNITEITKDLFDTFNLKLDDNEKAVIVIKARSITKVIFKLINNSKEVKYLFLSKIYEKNKNLSIKYCRCNYI